MRKMGVNEIREKFQSAKMPDYITANNIIFYDTTEEEFNLIWKEYFDLERDYPSICERLKADKHLEKAITECAGIRILKQDPFETLISFILSDTLMLFILLHLIYYHTILKKIIQIKNAA